MDAENNVEQTNLQEQTQSNEQATLNALIELYSTKTRQELVGLLKEELQKGDFDQMRIRIPLIRNAFSTITKQAVTTIEQPKQEDNSSENISLETENQTDNSSEQVEQTSVEEDPVEKEFYALYNEYKAKRQQHIDAEQAQKEDNLKKKQELLEQLKVLLDSDKSLKEIYDDFNAIQDKWKAIGNVPHNEVNNLWESYHFLIDKFYEKVKINRELRDLDMKKNLEEKLILCEKAEELLLSDDINNSFRILQDYHKQWKEIGPVPSDKNDEIWERFKKASDDINTRRKEYYEQRSEELEANLKEKQALVEQATQINSHHRESFADWNKDAELMTELVNKWKTIGRVPNQYNEEIWNKFKAQKDGFFEARKEVYNQNKKVEEDNYNKKLELCQAAEEIAKRTDFDNATKELLALQQEWKKIGYVRKSLSEKVWQRFRSACDEFFAKKSENYMQTHQEVEANIQKKQSLIEELKAYVFSDDKNKNLEILKDFQKRWFEVGFTPKQERQKLQSQWEEIIKANKDKLQISAQEIADKGTAALGKFKDVASGGKEALAARVRVLEKQISSVENNLGFLAQSKNADLLRKEFETKIETLKREKQLLLDRIKQTVNEVHKPENNEPQQQQEEKKM